MDERIVPGMFLVFLFLKLDGTLDWSWWAVTSPLWVWLIVAVVAGTIASLVRN